MAEGNGASPDGMALPPETVKFRIGREEFDVPEIMFGDAKVLRQQLQALGPQQDWIEYCECVLAVVSYQLRTSRPEVTEEYLAARLPAGEAANSADLRRSMNRLLEISGFPMAGPTPAPPENPGTGTLTDAAQSSPSEGSAEAIPGS